MNAAIDNGRDVRGFAPDACVVLSGYRIADLERARIVRCLLRDFDRETSARELDQMQIRGDWTDLGWMGFDYARQVWLSARVLP